MTFEVEKEKIKILKKFEIITIFLPKLTFGTPSKVTLHNCDLQITTMDKNKMNKYILSVFFFGAFFKFILKNCDSTAIIMLYRRSLVSASCYVEQLNLLLLLFNEEQSIY